MDNLLFEFVRTASADSFRAIVTAHAPGVRAHAHARLRDPHAADDVTQAVFIMLSRKAKSLGAHTVLGGWLHGATRFACKAYLRAASRRRKHEHAAASARPEQLPTPAPTIDTREIIDQALSRLACADRDVLLLRYQEGLGVPEVATRLGLTDVAAKKRLTRAATRFRGVLTNLGGASLPAGASIPTGIDWISGPLAPPPVDPVLANTILNNLLTPSSAAAGATQIVNGASSMVRRNFIVASAAASLVLAAVAGGAMVLFPLPAEPASTPVVALAIAQAPATKPAPAAARPAARPGTTAIETPANAFKRLCDSIAAGDELASIDCFITRGNPKQSAVVSLARLSAAEARVESAWKKVFPDTPAPATMGQRMDQVLNPMVPLLVMLGPRMMPSVEGNEVVLTLRDAKIPIPRNSPAHDWMDVGIRLERGKDGQWRFDVAGMMRLTVVPALIPPPGTPDTTDYAALNVRLFDDLVGAANAFINDLADGQFTDTQTAREDYHQRIATALELNKVRSFYFAAALNPGN